MAVKSLPSSVSASTVSCPLFGLTGVFGPRSTSGSSVTAAVTSELEIVVEEPSSVGRSGTTVLTSPLVLIV